ncbi:DUF5316 family protein [Sporosarcina sp. FSL W7-1349]|uniref:DUF5316 family protein n=1 Tax=Sporosarcina sp. FSL W7-1349 TaxID=2921561 RepID=UPI0030F618C7
MFNFFIIGGIVFVVISGLSLGAWSNGAEQRANFHSETKEHRGFRERIALYSGIIGIIFLGIATILWIF